MSSEDKNYEKIGNKPINYIPGINGVYQQRLEENGYNNISVILGMFLLLKRNKDLFILWLMEEYKFPKIRATKCYVFMYFYSEFILKIFNKSLE